MKLNKHLLLLSLTISSLLGIRSQAQTVTPQWKAVTGGLISYFYPSKSPAGFDTLWNAQTIRGYIASHGYAATNGLTLTGNAFGLGGILTDYTGISLGGFNFIINGDQSLFTIADNGINAIVGSSSLRIGLAGLTHQYRDDPSGIDNETTVGADGIEFLSSQLLGAKYQSKYNFPTDRYIPDKGAVDSIAKAKADSINLSTNITFENGITKTSGVARWGGVLTEQSTLDLGDNYIDWEGNIAGSHGFYEFSAFGATMQSYYHDTDDVTTKGLQRFVIDPGNIGISSENIIDNKRTSIGITPNNGILITDDYNLGMKYSSHPNFALSSQQITDRQYVDSIATAKADSVSSASGATFVNGLTKSGDNVSLGGTIINGTELNGTDDYFAINFTSSDGKYFGSNATNAHQVSFTSIKILPDTSMQTGVTSDNSRVYMTSNITTDSTRAIIFELNNGKPSDSYPTSDTTYTGRFTDNLRHLGIVYSKIDRNKYTDTTLVDKGYVDSIAGPGLCIPINGDIDIFNTKNFKSAITVGDVYNPTTPQGTLFNEFGFIIAGGGFTTRSLYPVPFYPNASLKPDSIEFTRFKQSDPDASPDIIGSAMGVDNLYFYKSNTISGSQVSRRLFELKTDTLGNTNISGNNNIVFNSKTEVSVSPSTPNSIVRLQDAPVSTSLSQPASAVTTITVPIGIQANNTYKIQLTPTNSDTMVKLFVNNKTTTTFDVTFESAITGTISFDYSIFK